MMHARGEYHGFTVACSLWRRPAAGGQQVDIALPSPQAGVPLFAAEEVLGSWQQRLPACWAGPLGIWACSTRSRHQAFCVLHCPS